jgi:hypothetical protein
VVPLLSLSQKRGSKAAACIALRALVLSSKYFST